MDLIAWLERRNLLLLAISMKRTTDAYAVVSREMDNPGLRVNRLDRTVNIEVSFLVLLGAGISISGVLGRQRRGIDLDCRAGPSFQDFAVLHLGPKQSTRKLASQRDLLSGYDNRPGLFVFGKSNVRPSIRRAPTSSLTNVAPWPWATMIALPLISIAPLLYLSASATLSRSYSAKNSRGVTMCTVVSAGDTFRSIGDLPFLFRWITGHVDNLGR